MSEVVKVEVEEKQKQIAESQAQIKDIIRKVLSGRCPIRITEKTGKLLGIVQYYEKTLKPLRLLKYLTGTTDYDIALEIIVRGVRALPNSMSVAERYNTVLQALADSPPKDATEARFNRAVSSAFFPRNEKPCEC